ncbi:uncharacterized protein PFL1_04574 [Pseudozyma flocculosa PF-1]|uniref:Uncharacterized protein n=2 Tax=Pseudozyma flocculosa TaxID=84751 RepID=A0A5C3F9B2_9BASI|nr:uncharacterized protein PFL1_04574 [Pseudozyma flocculosa PF-1]EPQ27829.1 hypothetical protein PFL1_04574 [Pseudozyma flocculosa PF-1]SPO41043.1 uncharacterized protein PSFLO_06525 [Pseudozyma flocculosa]
MVKAGKLKRSERRQPEAFPIIKVDDDEQTPSSATSATAAATASSNQALHRPHQTQQQQAPAKRTTNRGKTRQKDARAKAQKAIENAEKLAHRAMMVNVRAEKKKRAKA